MECFAQIYDIANDKQTLINFPSLFVVFIRIRHIPKAKATAIADTPELKRIAENTKIQSNVKYHADFEKNKGKLTQVGAVFFIIFFFNYRQRASAHAAPIEHVLQ